MSKKKTKTDEFHVYGALDRTCLLMCSVDRELLEDVAIKAHPKWKKKAKKAHHALFELYNMIGEKHIGDDDK